MRLNDLTGQKFGRLTVIRRAESRYGRVSWECACDCGKTKICVGGSLVRALTQSCGCLHKERASETSRRHGKTRTPTYNAWVRMHSRCRAIAGPTFEQYRSRGITVCDEWKNFETFYADMGEMPAGKSLDRIDNNLGYFKDNCRWADDFCQANNKRSNVFLTIFGRTMTIANWAKESLVPYATIRRRVSDGWDHERAVFSSTKNLIEYSGHCMTIRDWAAHIGIPPATLRARLTIYGWPIERALATCHQHKK